MAPSVADAPVPAQRQARRPLSRVVPAIPHRLSRTIPAARPITPEESNKGTVTAEKNGSGPQAVGAEKQAEEQLPQTSAVDAPMTPDSRASTAEKSEEDTTVLAASPAKSTEDHVERTPLLHGEFSPRTTATLLSKRVLTWSTSDAHVAIDTNGGAPSSSSDQAVEPKPATNGHHRKLNIPTELPPPFFPSNRVDSEVSPPSTGKPVPLSHRSQLSAGAAAFSVLNSSPATPAEPNDFGQDRHATLPRPPPGFAPTEFVPSFYPGHAQHPSDTGSAWPYPLATPHQDPNYSNGVDYQNGHPATTYENAHPPRDRMNGAANSPSKSFFGEMKPGSELGDAQRMVPYQNGMTSHEGMEESPFELAAYLSTQFGNPEFADFILHVRSPESLLVSIPVHGIVVARSPVIAEAVRRSLPAAHRSRDTRRMLDIIISDPFVTRESLEEATKVLYGAPLLLAHNFLYGVTPYDYDSEQPSLPSDARRRMQQLLSYIAAGRALQIPSMQARGVDIARSLLRWDTVDEVLQVALQSSSSKEGFEADDMFSAALLNYAIEFMAFTFPVDFKLHNVAPELQHLPRLPVLRESRPSTHNPRLSKIRFGDAPPGDGVQPTHASRVLSSVLLSLPLPLVDRILNHRATANQLGWSEVTKLMRDVINEREERRQRALKGHVKPAPDSHSHMRNKPLQNLRLEERIEQVEESPMHPSGYRLLAQHVEDDN